MTCAAFSFFDVSPPALGSAGETGATVRDLNGPTTLCALAHAPISSALSSNRYRTTPSSPCLKSWLGTTQVLKDLKTLLLASPRSRLTFLPCPRQ